ncbi:MAG: ABC transporter ATP-binding protein [Oscillospiraceae bacterium]|nr:ABC transporter ATP-binding protein [Oscillospiraceae bacterium]
MIRATNITKKFGPLTALDGLDLHAGEGSVYGLIGPNGAGKTTLIKILAGIYRPDSGAVELCGGSPWENPKVKGRCCYISDDPYFFSSYSLLDTAGLYASVYPGWSQERFNKLREAFNIDPKRRPSRLSRGTKKQAAFWLALSAMPKVLLLDEPIDGLDPVMRRGVWSLIMQDVAERGLTVLVSSHNLRELEDVCDHVGAMSSGRIFLEKSLDDAKGDIHKLQLAFSNGLPVGLEERLTILHRDSLGSVHTLIVKGGAEEISAAARAFSPLICEILPLSLEEIFIYEMNQKGYDPTGVII